MSSDVIAGMATAEARRLRRFRDEGEEARDREEHGLPDVPLLHVCCSPGGSTRWTVRSSGEQGHPNEIRMQLIREWLEREVLAEGEEGDPCGTYRLELHDSVSYLPRAGEYREVLSFGRTEDASPSVAMFPDPYQIAGYQLGPPDDIPWIRKRPSVSFAGSTTGHLDPARNARVQACLWAHEHATFHEMDFRISAVVQMRPYDVMHRFPRLADVIAPHVSTHTQFRHRFIANIVGNTACWSRVPMVLRSRSVLFHLTHNDAAWYYPAMGAGTHYVECPSPDHFLSYRASLSDNHLECARMTTQANLFVDQYLTRRAAADYARRLLFDIRGK